MWEHNDPNYLVLSTFCRISIGRPLDSTGHPLEFCKSASNILELPISSRNAIKSFTGLPVKFTLEVH